MRQGYGRAMRGASNRAVRQQGSMAVGQETGCVYVRRR